MLKSIFVLGKRRLGTGESPLVCKKKQRRKHRLGVVAPKILLRQYQSFASLELSRRNRGFLIFTKPYFLRKCAFLHPFILFQNGIEGLCQGCLKAICLQCGYALDGCAAGGSRPDPPETWDARRFRAPFSHCPLRLPPRFPMPAFWTCLP